MVDRPSVSKYIYKFMITDRFKEFTSIHWEHCKVGKFKVMLKTFWKEKINLLICHYRRKEDKEKFWNTKEKLSKYNMG